MAGDRKLNPGYLRLLVLLCFMCVLFCQVVTCILMITIVLLVVAICFTGCANCNGLTWFFFSRVLDIFFTEYWRFCILRCTCELLLCHIRRVSCDWI